MYHTLKGIWRCRKFHCKVISIICSSLVPVQKLFVNIYVYMYMYFPYTSSVICRIYNGIVIQYWRSCTPSRSIGECAAPGLNAILCFLWFTNCVLLFDKKSTTRMLVAFGICLKQYFDTRYLVFYNTSPPRMFLSLDFL